MNWNEIFNAGEMPSNSEIKAYIGDAVIFWDDLTSYLEETYHVKPQTTFSRCSMQPGWNVKYRKNNKALCTLYPSKGGFLALVVVGAKEEEDTRVAMNAGLFTDYVKGLYEKTGPSSMGRWLMIAVTEWPVLEDVKHLISIRVSLKKNTVPV